MLTNYLVLWLALAGAVVAVVGFIWTVRSGQVDDLDTPPQRLLLERESARPPAGAATTTHAAPTATPHAATASATRDAAKATRDAGNGSGDTGNDANHGHGTDATAPAARVANRDT